MSKSKTKKKGRVMWGFIYVVVFLTAFLASVVMKMTADPFHGKYTVKWDGLCTICKVTQKPGKRLPLEENCLPTAYIKMYRQISMNKVYGTAQFICCSKDMKRHPKHLWARMPNFFQYALSGCRTGCRKELVYA